MQYKQKRGRSQQKRTKNRSRGFWKLAQNSRRQNACCGNESRTKKQNMPEQPAFEPGNFRQQCDQNLLPGTKQVPRPLSPGVKPTQQAPPTS